MAIPPVSPAVPLDQPLYGATLRQAASRFFRKYATFTGRASRSELWWAILCTSALVLVAMVPFLVTTIGQTASLIGFAASGSSSPPFDVIGWTVGSLVALVPMLVVSFGIFVPTLALLARRHHDVGWSGWLLLLAYPTGGIWSIVVGFMPSRLEGLRYEPPGSTPVLSPDLAPPPYAAAAPGMAGQPFAAAQHPGAGQPQPRR